MWLPSSFFLSFPSFFPSKLLQGHKPLTQAKDPTLTKHKKDEENWDCQHYETHYQGSKTKSMSKLGMHNAAVTSNAFQLLPEFVSSRILFLFSPPLSPRTL